MYTMSEGYITLAISPQSVERAAALAASTKIADPTREFCLLTDKFSSVPSKYEGVFDMIIELPYGNSDHTEDEHINIWQTYLSSPFDRTLYLDNKVLVLSDINHIWAMCQPHEIVFPKSVFNFKGEAVPVKYKFSVHNKNNIPNYYTDVFYFEKSERAQQIFKMIDVVMQGHRRIYAQFVNDSRPDYFDWNLLVNVALKLLGEESDIHGSIPYTYVSLYNLTLDDRDLPVDWTDYYSTWYTEYSLKINNHRQVGIVCYNSENFIEEEILDDLRSRTNFNKVDV